MGDFVPQELWDHVPYPWAESASEEAKAYGMLLEMQSETVDAMREEGACLAREKIARAVRREIVMMTYAADAGHLELDVHVRVCWVPKREVDRILVDEHAAATERVDNFFATIKQLHTERAPMKRILAVVTPISDTEFGLIGFEAPEGALYLAGGFARKRLKKFIPYHSFVQRGFRKRSRGRPANLSVGRRS
jgi:hypothetical protein